MKSDRTFDWTDKMMDVEGVEDDGDATIKSIATKTERLVFTWPIRYIKSCMV